MPSSGGAPSSSPIATSVKRDAAAHMYHVSLQDNTVLRFPYVWLRDNCRCVDCYDPNSKYRLSLVHKLDPDIEPLSEEIDESGTVLKIEWPELHISKFTVSWLAQMRFSEMEPEIIDPFRYPKRLWEAKDMKDNIPTFQFDDILQSHQTMYDWLQALMTHGLALIKSAPQEPNTIDRLGKRVFFLKQTHYGKVSRVVNQADHTNIGFTTRALTLHVDLPYLEYCPGIELLHCVYQSAEGGENQFTDVFNCALKLKEKHPDFYEVLTTTLVDFRDWGVPKTEVTHNYDDHHLKHRKPVLELNAEGNLKTVNYSDALRAPYFRTPVEKVHLWYKAYTALNALMVSPENKIEIKLEGGEIACFDNQRLCHARNAFKLAEQGQSRCMETGYIDWDQATSRMRVIRERQGEEPM